MMTPICTTTLLLLLLLLLLLAKGQGSTVQENHAVFADSLSSVLYKEKNECSSALGVSMAFSLIYPGSTGESTEQIQTVFGYPPGDKMTLVWEDTASRLNDSYQGESQEPLLDIAFSVWLDDNMVLADDYARVLGNHVRQIDFQSAKSPIIVNEWVKNKTNGLIESIVSEDVPLAGELLAINSIYLKARWSKPFEKRYTNIDSFYSSVLRETIVSRAHFMSRLMNVPYSQDAIPGYQIVELPYKASTMSMIFVLPTEEDSKSLSSTDVLEAISLLEASDVFVTLPKFKFEKTYKEEMKKALQEVGVVKPFNGDLCDIFGACGLRIGEVIQKTVIDVNEEGTEAAAVTSIPLGFSGEIFPEPEVLMTMDHPFQFFIYDKDENLVLFEGRLGSPELYLSSATTSNESEESIDISEPPTVTFAPTSSPTVTSPPTTSGETFAPTSSPTVTSPPTTSGESEGSNDELGATSNPPTAPTSSPTIPESSSSVATSATVPESSSSAATFWVRDRVSSLALIGASFFLLYS